MSRTFDLSQYVTVHDRIIQFWQEYPEGRIHTRLESDATDFKSCRYAAWVYKYKDDLHPAATGWAFEHAGERGPNQTSHEENCETSAIGRALANMGYATSQKDRPSREEMEKVQRGSQQDAPIPTHTQGSQPTQHTQLPAGELLSDPQRRKIFATTREKQWSDEQLHFRILTEYGARSLNDLTKRAASDFIEYLLTEAPPPPQELATDFLGECNGLQAAQTMDELHAVWKVVYRSYENDLVLRNVAERIKDARKAELSNA